MSTDLTTETGASSIRPQLHAVPRRIEVAPETIAELESKLPDCFDIYEAGGRLQSYGLTLDEAINRLGGSP
jgi:hypothetical protein